jgi:hypothetical protein
MIGAPRGQIKGDHEMDVTQRIMELHEEGKTDREIAEQLEAVGIRNQNGKPFTKTAIRARRERFQKHQKAQMEASAAIDLVDFGAYESGRSLVTDKIADTPEPPAYETADEPISEISEPLKSQIIQIVQKEIERMVGQTFTAYRAAEGELPPDPDKIAGPRGKRIALGERVKVAGTADAELLRLFELWRKEKRISFSKALDAVLWHFLGKPKLSFELRDASATGSDGWSVLHATPPEDYED